MSASLDGHPALLSQAAVSINLLGLALLTWGMTGEAHPGLAGSHLAALVLLIVANCAWLVWAYTRFREVTPAVMYGALAVMAATGGALTVFAPLSVTYVGVASLGATTAWNVEPAAVIAALGPAASLLSLGLAGHALRLVVGAVAASLAGAVMGMSRRDSQLRTAQAASVQVAEARAELLAGRNHLARELHDVLAHTLSALSLQLQALDSLIADGRPVPPAVSEQLEHIKRLVREGLDEARGAVQALREDVPPLDTRLTKLAAERHAGIEVRGEPRDLPPEVSLALYRVAQEALTNATKHAPGVTAEVRLDYSAQAVGLSVSNAVMTNGSSDNRDPGLGGTGGGYGIQGIKERVLLLGGQVEAGPVPGGWLVSAEVPA